MSDEIKIPDTVFAEAYNASVNSDRQFSSFAQEIARWMREECAKVAENYYSPEVSEVHPNSIAYKIRLIGTRLP